ncbi:MFS general substrate transporter [Violaceomyces palustris]|uniref:MFS general substrate transporter n=1 Tax=Violaceomyces palustris TaxID=1673888 RepID=A0ACD0NM65_9BASI|nr:MFS general substrate transporter [Violaceomyces palustris]
MVRFHHLRRLRSRGWATWKKVGCRRKTRVWPKGGPSRDQEQTEGTEGQTEAPLSKVLPIMSSCFLAVFLVSLDRTIVATAIPTITDRFHSIGDIGYYGSSYMVANSILQLVYGRLYEMNPVKAVYSISMIVFAVGSAICGAAPSSAALIVGRAIAGAGSAGILSGTIQIMLHLVPLHKRPLWTGAFGATFGVSSILGPVLGGAFTQKVSWRWCFYINLPFTAVALIVVAVLLKSPPTGSADRPGWKAQLVRIDPVGTILVAASIICLILGLQYGSGVGSWSSARVVGLLVGFGVALVAFASAQVCLGDRALIPPRIFAQRSVFAGFWYSFLLSASMTLVIYFLPIWFQAIKEADAAKSGYMLIPCVLSLVVGSLLGGSLTQRLGYYVQNLFLTPMIASIGIGLITTFTTHTVHANWIGYQVVYGLGLGIGMQVPSLAAQTVLERGDVPIGVALMFFSQQIGGSVGISIGQNVFSRRLFEKLATIPGVIDVGRLTSAGATEVRTLVPPGSLDEVVTFYNQALGRVWWSALGLTLAMLLPLPLFQFESIRKDLGGEKRGEEEKGVAA